jgi:hypothetical protein
MLQYSNGLSEFIQQGGRIDACSCNTLTSVAGCCEHDSLGIVRRGLFQFVPQRFVKAGCDQLCPKDCPTVTEAGCDGDTESPRPRGRREICVALSQLREIGEHSMAKHFGNRSAILLCRRHDGVKAFSVSRPSIGRAHGAATPARLC